MITIKLTKTKTKRGEPWFHMEAVDGSERRIISGGGASPKMAARWLIRNINQAVAEIEQAVVEFGTLSEAEVIEAGDEGCAHSKAPDYDSTRNEIDS